MPTDKQIDAATDAYLKARGWTPEMFESHKQGRAEIRERMIPALTAAEEAADVQDAG